MKKYIQSIEDREKYIKIQRALKTEEVYRKGTEDIQRALKTYRDKYIKTVEEVYREH